MGTYEHSIDKNNRLYLPIPIRERNGGLGPVVTCWEVPYMPNTYAFINEAMEPLLARLPEEEKQAVKSIFELTIQGGQFLVVTDEMIEKLGTRNVVLLENGNIVNIWAQEEYRNTLEYIERDLENLCLSPEMAISANALDDVREETIQAFPKLLAALAYLPEDGRADLEDMLEWSIVPQAWEMYFLRFASLDWEEAQPFVEKAEEIFGREQVDEWLELGRDFMPASYDADEYALRALDYISPLADSTEEAVGFFLWCCAKIPQWGRNYSAWGIFLHMFERKLDKSSITSLRHLAETYFDAERVEHLFSRSDTE